MPRGGKKKKRATEGFLSFNADLGKPDANGYGAVEDFIGRFREECDSADALINRILGAPITLQAIREDLNIDYPPRALEIILILKKYFRQISPSMRAYILGLFRRSIAEEPHSPHYLWIEAFLAYFDLTGTGDRSEIRSIHSEKVLKTKKLTDATDGLEINLDGDEETKEYLRSYLREFSEDRIENPKNPKSPAKQSRRNHAKRMAALREKALAELFEREIQKEVPKDVEDFWKDVIS